jgi:hypothetical protein
MFSALKKVWSALIRTTVGFVAALLTINLILITYITLSDLFKGNAQTLDRFIQGAGQIAPIATVYGFWALLAFALPVHVLLSVVRVKSPIAYGVFGTITGPLFMYAIGLLGSDPLKTTILQLQWAIGCGLPASLVFWWFAVGTARRQQRSKV